MIVKVKDIKSEGIDIDKNLPPEEIKLSESGFKCLNALHIKAHLEKADDEVIAQVEVDGKYEFECARCLDPLVKEREDKFTLYFDIEPKTEILDLGEDIRQEMIMDLTGKTLCHDDCKGLCPSCGVNLNRETCQCGSKTKVVQKFNKVLRTD